MDDTRCQRLAALAAVLAIAACDSAPAPESVALRPEAPTPVAEAPTNTTEAPAEAEEPEELVDPAALATAEIIAAAVREPDPFARARRLGELLPTLGPEGVYGAKRALQDASFSPGAGDIELLVRFWASQQPEEATRWAVEQSPTGFQISTILAALPVWVQANPQAALAAAKVWDAEPSLRVPLQIGLVRGWYERDPEELVQYLREMPPGIPRQRQISTYLRIVIEREGIEAVIRWVESVGGENPGFKQDVNRQLAVGLPNFDLPATLRWCELHCDEGKDLRGIIAQRWAQLGGGAKAVEWMLQAPREERESDLVKVFEAWALREPRKSATWLAAYSAGHPGEPWLNTLFATQALATMQESPPAAIEWALRMEDPFRERLLIRIVKAWHWQDETAANAWLETSPLSDEARERARGVPALRDRLPRDQGPDQTSSSPSA